MFYIFSEDKCNFSSTKNKTSFQIPHKIIKQINFLSHYFIVNTDIQNPLCARKFRVENNLKQFNSNVNHKLLY